MKITFSQYPYISNVQTVPDIDKREVRIVAEIATGVTDQPVKVSYSVRESKTKKEIAKGTFKQTSAVEKGIVKLDFGVALPEFTLWSPENPFLYDLELSTTGDNTSTRFGMRSFSASKDSGVVLLNGKPYYMRGTNVTMYRFFEDAERGNLPWDQKWVTKLHEKFKDMHWNSVRYCIGFPPERWYEIADSVGLLIQDEYPIWTMKLPKEKHLIMGVSTDQLVREYTQWMRERWNHACVVIWDAQNESIFPEIAVAINKVRGLDLSNRPWDNGWSAPASETDVIEAHPYIFGEYTKKGYVIKDNILKDQLANPRYPHNGPRNRGNAKATGAADEMVDVVKANNKGKVFNNPIIINEYGWLWINREGTPALASENLYAWHYPEADTPEKRFEVYAKTMGMLTEYWRTHRKCAGVLHFGALSFSRPQPPKSHTADHLMDVKNLEWLPFFEQYVKPSFSPVGLMIDLWDTKLKAGSGLDIKINLINDTYEPWKGAVKLSLVSEGQVLGTQDVDVELVSLGKKILSVPVKLTGTKGKSSLVAEIIYNGESVKSIREFVLE